MAQIEFAPEIFEDFERFFDHMALHEINDGPARIAEIIAALQILGHSPRIGRPTRGGKRELLIGKASRGYVVVYRYSAGLDIVFVLAIRSQRESDYRAKSL